MDLMGEYSTKYRVPNTEDKEGSWIVESDYIFSPNGDSEYKDSCLSSKYFELCPPHFPPADHLKFLAAPGA